MNLHFRCAALAGAALGLLGISTACLLTIDENLIDACTAARCDAGAPGRDHDCPAALMPDPSVAQVLPKAHVDTTFPAATGKTIAVPAGGDVQLALSQAAFGDVITLQAGATYTGPITLPNKTGSGWIIVRTSSPDAMLPPLGQRIDPSYSSALPKIMAPSGKPAIEAKDGPHHYRFVGIEITAAAGVAAQTLVELGGGEPDPSRLPHDLVFDRCYLHGDPTLGAVRGIAVNAAAVGVVDSYLSGFRSPNVAAHAITSSNSPGPIRLVNDYLESAGENVAIGDAAPAITGLVLADVELCANHLTKPQEPDGGADKFAGFASIKSGRRILMSGNVMENAGASQAVAFMRNALNGAVPWAVVSDVTFVTNLVRGASGGVTLGGGATGAMTERFVFRDNVFADIGSSASNGDGIWFSLLGASRALAIAHNTSIQDGSIMVVSDPPHDGVSMKDNIAPHNAYGIIGTGSSPGTTTMSMYLPGIVFVGNVLPGGKAASYPANNYFPASLSDVGFVDMPGGDYHLNTNSAYRGKASDGTDPGADIDALTEAISGVAH